MRHRLVPAWILALAAVLPFAPAVAGQDREEPAKPAWTYGAEMDLNSKYVWRALAWSEGFVAQPSVWLGRSDFVLSVWSNYVLGDEPNRRQFNEVDLRLAYARAWGRWTLEPAFNIYSYPHQDREENPTTGELEIQLSYDLAPFTLETAHFVDVVANGGGYTGELGIEFESEIAPGLALTAASRLIWANAKFNAYYVPFERAAVDSAVFELGLGWDPAGPFSFRPHFEWTQIIGSGLRDAVRTSPWVSIGKPSLVNIGLIVGFEY